MPTRATTDFIFFLLLVGISNGAGCRPGNGTLSASRRILHQPFFPSGSSPPSEPPSPPPSSPNSKYPFSSSTPDQTPFFPSFSSPPPPSPPSSGAASATFPANISSLIIPHSPSKPISRKLVAVTAALCASAVIVASIALFFYFRGSKKSGRRSDAGDKVSRSENSSAFGSETRTNIPPPRNRRTASSNSSEFLYLGTLVNSHGIDGSGAVVDSSNCGDGGGTHRWAAEPRKLDSPELQPLPPLRQRRNYGNAEAAEEEEEEFYSPRGSASGGESSGSDSGRVLAAVEAENFSNDKNTYSSTSSRSSPTTCSPEQSASLSISPPISNSPKSTQLKSPELVEMQRAPPFAPPSVPLPLPLPRLSFLSSPLDSSPERVLESIKEQESPLLSNNSRSSGMSPRLSTVTLSAINTLDLPATSGRNQLFPSSTHPASSPPLSNASTSSRRSSSSLILSPFLRGQSNDYSESTRKSNSPVSTHSTASSSISSPRLSSSPLRGSGKESPQSPLASNALGRNVRSHPASPKLANDLGQRFNSTPASPVSQNRSSSPSPPRLSIASDRSYPPSTLIPRGSQQAAGAPPPPPPPPPPPLPIFLPPISNPAVTITPPSKPGAFENQSSVSPNGEAVETSEETPKPKLKPLHWDKVKASSDREMVWDHLRSSSFKLNEEMIETLFVVNTHNSNPKGTTKQSILPLPKQETRVLDPKKAQNIAILLRALNVTMEEICEALVEGNADRIGTELLESLLKMAPTKEEERKLKEYNDADLAVKLGPAERFLKAVIDVPFAFKRVEALLYMANFESEIEYLNKSFETLEAACDELRNSRMFLKLLEAVLKTGNRMNVGTNRGDAHAFKLDTLLKLVDVKGADGKTTLLHFVVHEIIRSEGARLTSDPSHTVKSTSNDDAKCRKLGLQVVSALSSELANVKKAAAMDSDVLSNDLYKLSMGLTSIIEIVRLIEESGSDQRGQIFSKSMNQFVKVAEGEIIRARAQESVALSLVKEITEYFHGNSAKEEAHPFRIFMVVRDFLTILDGVCKEVAMINEQTVISSAHRLPVPVNPMLLPVPLNPAIPQVFAGFHGNKQYVNSDDDTSP
ncbi:hypothetical protein Nepgr_022692 [Nepenthes gracilis]|uniref:Formin-like protein n=1 Tax=Nepenthes gracilis TaxID=150966 RepID=A0AAD3XYE4_NEPGR|nr:hypothetical protein Nepgr_022692 [Nepenthes gracilis]